MVVSGGRSRSMNGMSLKPTTDMSAGQFRPISSSAAKQPIASMSLPAATAVHPVRRSSSARVQRSPSSIENAFAVTIRSGSGTSPCASIADTKP